MSSSHHKKWVASFLLLFRCICLTGQAPGSPDGSAVKQKYRRRERPAFEQSMEQGFRLACKSLNEHMINSSTTTMNHVKPSSPFLKASAALICRLEWWLAWALCVVDGVGGHYEYPQ
jgi:hypothetical protein